MEFSLLTFGEAISAFSFVWAIALFFFYFIAEMLDSSLTFSLTQHKSLRSAVITFVLYTTLAVEVVAIVSNYLYVIPIAAGAALGSFSVVEYEKKKRPLKK